MNPRGLTSPRETRAALSLPVAERDRRQIPPATRAVVAQIFALLAALGSSPIGVPALRAQQGPFEVPDDPFLCYRGKTQRGDLAVPTGLQATLTDDLEVEKVFAIRKPRGVCNPANQNGQEITDDVTHLTPYQIRPIPGEPAHSPVANITVFNQFGTLVVTTIREDRVLLPAHADETGGPVTAPLVDDNSVDNYKCYKVRTARGTPRFPRNVQVVVEDGFESPAMTFDVLKPRLLCTAVDKNGEGIKKPDGHLMCYKVRSARGQAKHVRRIGVSTADQFVIHKIDTKREELLCVPSLKDPPAEFCGDGKLNQPPFEECDGSTISCPIGQPCNRFCDCVEMLGPRTFSLITGSSFFNSFVGLISLGTPQGTLVLDAGAIDGTGTAPVTLVNAPAYVTVDVNIGIPQTVCYEFLSCTGSVHCAGGVNVDVLQSLDSLASIEPSCIQDGSHACPNDPSSLCCSNSCEGALVGSGNSITTTTGVGGADSGPGAVLVTCDMRTINELPLPSDCSVQDYSSVPVSSVALTTGVSTGQVTQHCAGSGAGPSAMPGLQISGSNFDCGEWGVAGGDGTLAWTLPTEEPTTFVGGDGSSAFIYED